MMKSGFGSKRMWSGLAAMVLGMALLAGCKSPEAIKEPATFRVMSYNIHHGENTDGKIDLLAIAEVIKKEQPDVVALQEVDKGVERTARRDFPAELAALTGMKIYFNVNLHYQGGEYGNAVLTRFPILMQTNTHYRMIRPDEHRGIIQMILDVKGRKLLFMATHIDYRPDDTERLLNAAQIGEIIQQYQGLPMVMCGDFNSNPDSNTHKKVSEMFTDVWEVVGQGQGLTYSSVEPQSRIDYIWISKEGKLRPLKAWVPQTKASDHMPLVADLELK